MREGWQQSSTDSNKCYSINVSKKIWSDAEAFCENSAPNAHLTSILSAFEQSNIDAITCETSSVILCDQLWIGGNDFNNTNQFMWSDGRPFTYANWNQGQPDLSNQCVSAQTRTTGKWKTQPCQTENCFICESYPNRESTTVLSTSSASVTTALPTMTDCYDWRFIAGKTTDGIYKISPRKTDIYNVYCDMHTDGGGYTVIQRRLNNQTVFWNRLWTDYVNGFGSGLKENFWLGLDQIHVLSTKDVNVTLRIDVRGNRCNNTDYSCGAQFDPNGYWFGEWTFQIDNATQSYRLHISTANEGNLSKLHSNDFFWRRDDGQVFQTVDHDVTSENCTYRAYSG
uniref:Uncharacterized protein n=1 Tax=Plectus sambesii TaxID=2011161 RepID=A0A914V515_9BILA